LLCSATDACTAKKILVAHDFSDPASRALVFAADLAAQLGAEVELLHVHPDVYDGHSDPSLGLPWPAPDQVERYLRFLDSELERAAITALGPERGRKLKRHVVRGEPAKRIAGQAKELGADLLCVGSTGKGAVERVLLGSVSQRILRTSEIPVLTVH
jgi:nucleotide-binding universal stress UspA family protein